jgi:hypothetical protein
MPIVDVLNQAFTKAVRDASLIENFLAPQAFEPASSTQEAFNAFTKQDRVWAQKVIQATNIKLDAQ